MSLVPKPAGEGQVKRVLGLIILVAVTLSPITGETHPGRLNQDGCHHVRKDFIYKSGKVVRKGEYHCHRLLVGKPAVLDGSEVLAERGDDQKDEEEERGEEIQR